MKTRKKKPARGEPLVTFRLAGVVVFSVLTGLLWYGCSDGQSQSAKDNQAQSVSGVRSTDSHIIPPQKSNHFWVFAESKDELGAGGEFHVYVDAETHPDAEGSFAKFSLGVGGELPIHRHDKTEEIAYFISGSGVVQLFEKEQPKEVSVGEGYVWYNPPGAWHSVKNTCTKPLTMVFVTIPNEKEGLLSFFKRIGAKPGHEATPLRPEEFGRIAAEHDLILKPPPSQK